MTIPLTPSISLSPSSFSGSGQTITASVTLPNRPAYAGHPKITGLTTITPKIVCSRVPTGVFPFFVQVSACETTSNAGKTYRDLDYRWDFGDSSGTETMTDHATGKTVNCNTSQTGPEAGYLYRTAGTYTITLTVSGKDENGTTVTASTTSLLTLGQYYIFMGQATGGTYTLTVNGETTSAIAYNASSATILAALHALASLDSTNVRMTFEGCVEFFGNLTGTTITFTMGTGSLTGATGTPQLRTENASGTSSIVTVNDHTGLTVQYFDSTAGGGGDGTIGSPKNSTAELTAFFNAADDRVAYIKRGSTFASASFGWDKVKNRLRLLPYGTGAKPIFTGAAIAWELNWGSAGTPVRLGGDVVFSEMNVTHSTKGNFMSSYASNNNDPNYPFSRLRDVVLDNIDYQETGSAGDASFFSMQSTTGRGMCMSNLHIWNCNVAMGETTRSNMFTDADQWFCVIGGTVSEGTDETLTRDHHIYSNTKLHTCFRYIGFENGWDVGAGEAPAMCLNWNADNASALTAYHLIDGCDLTGTANGIDISNTNNTDYSPLGYFTDVIVQHNKFHTGQVGTQLIAFYAANCETIVIRYNDFWGLHKGIGQFLNTSEFSIYYNRCHNTRWSFYDHTYMYFSYNLIMTDGHSDFVRGPCLVFDGSAAYTTAQTWDANCVGNVYWSDDTASNLPFYETGGSTWISFATWQGFGNDTGGQNTNPGWYAPASGQFVEGPVCRVNWPDGFTSLETSINGGSSWQAYDDNDPLAFAAYVASATTVLFRAVTDTSTSNQTIAGASSADSLDTAQESYSALLTYQAGATYYAFSAGGLTYIFSTGGA